MEVLHNHVGELLREAREQQGWSQEHLADRLRLARPISVSKWERGQAPLPVHHWQSVMRLLRIPRRALVEAARRERHRQLPIYLSLSESLESVEGFGDRSWDFIIRALPPESSLQLDELRGRYPKLSPAAFVQAAMVWFLEEARQGLDRQWRPIRGGGGSCEANPANPGRRVRHVHPERAALPVAEAVG